MTPHPKVLVVGRSGQIATALRTASWPGGISAEACGRESLDLRRAQSIEAVIDRCRWSAIVNAAGYTQVDRAESDSEAAFAVNRDGPATLARACARVGIPLIHISTDYVFDGVKTGTYIEDDPIGPLSVYGASKAAGETAIRAQHAAHIILRTSWVFSATGQNFVKTMLRSTTRGGPLRVVEDQKGRPTAAQDVADAIVHIVAELLAGKTDGLGTFHFANSGTTSWYGFACEIFRQAALRGFAPTPDLRPVSSSEYAAEARRPANSVLNTNRLERVYGIRSRPWEQALSQTLDVLIGRAKTLSLAPAQ